MQITLFKAVKSVRIGDELATDVVDRLEGYVETVVNNNITRVEGGLVGIKATLEALKMQMGVIGAMIGIVGLAIVAGPIIAKCIR